MGKWFRGSCCAGFSLVHCVCAVFLTLASAPSQAAQAWPRLVAPLIIENDYGGYLLDRLRQIETLRGTAQPVEIRGEVCYSTCTMLLGLDTVCVLPTTTFGFHGPSRAGDPLPPDLFDRASRIIASFYPGDLRRWYLAHARHELHAVLHRSGRDLIALGVPECEGDA